MENRLVRVTSTGRNSIGLVRLGGGVSGNLDLEKRRLGNSSLAENVTVFRYTGEGLEYLSLNDLGAGPISNGEISYAHLNWAGRVDIIVLGGVNNGSVFYGRTAVLADYHAETDSYTYRLAVRRNDGTSVGPFNDRYNIPSGTYVAAVVANDGTGFSSLQRLTALEDVPNTAWSGQGAVTVDGRTYSIASDVMCYNRDISGWITAAEGRSALDIAHAYAQKCDMYASSDGVIRAIEVGGDFR